MTLHPQIDSEEWVEPPLSTWMDSALTWAAGKVDHPEPEESVIEESDISAPADDGTIVDCYRVLNDASKIEIILVEETDSGNEGNSNSVFSILLKLLMFCLPRLTPFSPSRCLLVPDTAGDTIGEDHQIRLQYTHRQDLYSEW